MKTVHCEMLHAQELSMTLSDADYNEMCFNRKTTSIYVIEALKSAIRQCQNTYTIIHKEQVLAIGGFTDSGCCWFLTSNIVDTLDKQDRKLFREELCKNRDEALLVHPILYNYIWKGNEAHVRFVESCGARFFCGSYGDHIPFQFHREDFPHLQQL